MYTYSHFIFFSSGATLSCCVLVCKNTGTCTVFDAKSSLMLVCMYMCVFKFFFEITEPTEDKFTWDHHGIGEKFYSNDSGQLLFFILSLSAGAGAFSGNFTTNLARQCRAFSRALKIEKLKAPLFRGLEGAGATNDWCITIC